MNANDCAELTAHDPIHKGRNNKSMGRWLF